MLVIHNMLNVTKVGVFHNILKVIKVGVSQEILNVNNGHVIHPSPTMGVGGSLPLMTS